MKKPRLVKVRAFILGFLYITKQRGCANFDTASLKSAVRTGLEPVTPCVPGMYANQLN